MGTNDGMPTHDDSAPKAAEPELRCDSCDVILTEEEVRDSDLSRVPLALCALHLDRWETMPEGFVWDAEKGEGVEPPPPPADLRWDRLRAGLGARGLAEATKDPDGVLRSDAYRTLDVLDAVRLAFDVPVTVGEANARAERAADIADHERERAAAKAAVHQRIADILR